MHKTVFKKVPSSTIPLFEETDKKSRSPRKHSPCVVIQRNGKDYFINKTTVVWLLQEERVSSDRLFRVRSKQPYSSDILKSVSRPVRVSNKLSTYDEIALGDVCVFEHQETSTWRIGKVLKFYYKQKSKASRQYRGSVAKVISNENIGVLCSWYTKLKELTYTCVPTADTEEVVHSYIPTSLYVCTMTSGCFQSVVKNSSATESVSRDPDVELLPLTTAETLTLTPETLSGIDDLLAVRKKPAVDIAQDKARPFQHINR